MKRLIVFLCVTLWVVCTPANAGSEIMVEKVMLDLKATEDKPLQQKLNINSCAHWEWIELDLVNKFTFPRKSDNYHNLELQIGFPQLTNDFGCDLSYDWNSRYRIFDVAMDTTWKPVKGLKLLFDVETGSKVGIIEKSELYSNDWNYQKIDLGYNLRDWNYKWKLDRKEIVYPKRESFTYTKYSLNQQITWDITRRFELGLKYFEETKEYPEADTKNYWKDEWTLWGKLRQGKNQRWNWQYRTLIWERGFDRYQDNSYVTADYQWWSRQWRVDAGLSWSDLKYFTETAIDDPENIDDEPEDWRSRKEEKVSLEITRYFKAVEWGVQLFASWKDYTSGVHKNSNGIISKITWEIGKYKIHFNIAPFGNNSSSKEYYQIKLEYNPKDVIE